VNRIWYSRGAVPCIPSAFWCTLCVGMNFGTQVSRKLHLCHCTGATPPPCASPPATFPTAIPLPGEARLWACGHGHMPQACCRTFNGTGCRRVVARGTRRENITRVNLTTPRSIISRWHLLPFAHRRPARQHHSGMACAAHAHFTRFCSPLRHGAPRYAAPCEIRCISRRYLPNACATRSTLDALLSKRAQERSAAQH